MSIRALVFVGLAGSVAALQSSLETIVTDTILGVTVAIALFVLYYALVLRRASGRGN